MVLDTANRITFSRHSNSRLGHSAIAVAVLIVCASSVTWVVTRLTGAMAGTVSSQQLVVIDTDPGIDDAVAILTTLGDSSVKVLGITCVRGNTDVPNVVINALKLLQVTKDTDVPVYSGKNYGLITSPATDNYYGTDGFGDVAFSDTPSVSNAQTEHAASFLARIVQEYPGEITVFALGPLTNIALAISLNPEFLQQVQRLIILGGSIRGQGNALPGVEFNFYMDPDAATVVLERALSSNTTVTLMPMETVLENDLGLDWRWNVLGKINNSAVSFLNALEKSEYEMHPSSVYHPFDAFAVGVMLAPHFVTYSLELYGFVENRAGKTNGALVVDYSNITSNLANLDIVIEVNITALKRRMYESLSNFT